LIAGRRAQIGVTHGHNEPQGRAGIHAMGRVGMAEPASRGGWKFDFRGNMLDNAPDLGETIHFRVLFLFLYSLNMQITFFKDGVSAPTLEWTPSGVREHSSIGGNVTRSSDNQLNRSFGVMPSKI
jgi:hypothetical protein